MGKRLNIQINKPDLSKLDSMYSGMGGGTSKGAKVEKIV